MRWLFLAVPVPILGCMMILMAIGFAVGGTLLVRRLCPVRVLKAHHDITGPMFGTVGVLYAVLLAFIVIVAWQSFDKAAGDVVREANYYGDVYRNSVGLDAAFRSKLRTAMDVYLNSVIEDEWPRLATGGMSKSAQQNALEVWALVGACQPQSEASRIFLAETVHRMNLAGEMRRQRLMNARNGIHPVLWLVLYMGAAITMGFAFCFGAESRRTHLAMNAMLALLITLILFTVHVLDTPFGGTMGITAEPFCQVLAGARAML